MKTPVVFIIFNRPDTTQKVFDAIKQAKPEKLIVIADGPRTHKEGEAEKCKQTRDIINSVDWKCEVIKEYSKSNLGCKKRVSSGITNAFKLVDRAIILEDDCLPNQSFFRFCEEMLEKYNNDKQIMAITGDNYLFEKSSMIKTSYYFSKIPNIWGWATWKRAWDKYDIKMKSWPQMKTNVNFNKSWTKRFQEAYENKIDTWDLQWVFSCLDHQGLSIVPRQNLVSNIGFANAATHTNIKTIVAEMATPEMQFPLIHPKSKIANDSADKISQFHFTRLGIIIDLIKKTFKK